MRDRLYVALLVPVLVLPLVVISAGGDLELLRQELRSLVTSPLVITVYAQGASPTATTTATPSGTVTMTPSGTVTMTPMFPSGTVTITPMGTVSITPSATVTVTVTPSGGVFTPTVAVLPAPVPVLSRWGMISGSIILALIALWALNRRMTGDRRGM